MALRTLAEKIGLPQYASMAKALGMLSRQARATFCNDFWQRDFSRVRLPVAAVTSSRRACLASLQANVRQAWVSRLAVRVLAWAPETRS